MTAASGRTLETLAEAARRHGVSTRTIRRRIADGTITGYRSGPRLIRVDALQVDAALLRPTPTLGAVTGGGQAPMRDAVESLSAFDLRLRSLDRKPGEPINVCTDCGVFTPALWSVWLHTPEWGTGDAGETRVLCTRHALAILAREADRVG